MSNSSENIPTPEYATQIIEKLFKEKVEKISRFSTGHCHYVFDVVTRKGEKYVARITVPENIAMFEGALFWSDLLKPLGIPFPKIYHQNFEAEFPFFILERFEGSDLWQVYSSLLPFEKQDLAIELNKLQNIVRKLPPAKSFGYLNTYQDNSGCKSWTELLLKMLNRSRNRIKQVGLFDSEIVDRVEKLLGKHEKYFANIQPIPFLDDITTKNVIIDNGKLSGIVDVDHLCFGDSLETVALTNMALIQDGESLDYIDYWITEMGLDSEQLDIINLYTAMSCVDFISEIGLRFNKDPETPIDLKRAEKLHLILKGLI